MNENSKKMLVPKLLLLRHVPKEGTIKMSDLVQELDRDCSAMRTHHPDFLFSRWARADLGDLVKFLHACNIINYQTVSEKVNGSYQTAECVQRTQRTSSYMAILQDEVSDFLPNTLDMDT